jgi:hypothetical protein
VRFVYSLLVAFKYGALMLWLPDVLDETRHSRCEQVSGHPIDEFVRQQAALIYHLLDLAYYDGELLARSLFAS